MNHFIIPVSVIHNSNLLGKAGLLAFRPHCADYQEGHKQISVKIVVYLAYIANMHKRWPG